MKLTYYGTAAAEGWPALFCQCESCRVSAEKGGKSIRTRSQALVNDDLLIDFPADTLMHTLVNGLDLNRVKDVLITHSHEDHFYPDDIACRQSGYTKFRAPHTLPVYGSDGVAKKYDQVAAVGWNTEMRDITPMVELTEYQPLELENYTVWPMLADHNPYEKCFIYVIRDKRDGKTLLYAHDTGYLREDNWEFMKDFHFDLVSLDCTFGKLYETRGHMGIDTCAQVKDDMIAKGLADEKTVFIVNHYSHNCKYLCHEEIEADAARFGMLASYDGMAVEV